MVRTRLMSLHGRARRLVRVMIDARAVVTGPLPLPTGAAEVRLETVAWNRWRVILGGSGASEGLLVGFEGRALVSAVPTRNARTDGFEVALPRPDRHSGVRIRLPGPAADIVLPAPGRLREALAAVAALPGVFLQILVQVPGILRFLGSGDRALAAELRRALGLVTDPGARPVPPDLFGEASPDPAHRDPPVVLIPVFNACADVTRLLDRLAGSSDECFRILLVDDASDDPRISGLLSRFRDRDPHRVTLLTLDRNRGFVGAVNAGLAALGKTESGHVILLNTDTIPPEAWVSRLLAPILADPDVASVTPLSNNAEILSVPAPGIEGRPEARTVDAIDAAARRIAPRHRAVDLPTGIGFCMALNRRFLDAAGGFDPAFGRGYGEEVDWSRKVRAMGGRHLCAANLFVGHRGGASFGDEKAARLAASARLIARRYPDYDAEVAGWIAADPIHAQRLALGIAWLAAASPAPVPVWISHAMGGGAEAALAEEIAAALAAGLPGGIVLRAGGPAAWRLELIGTGFRLAGDLPEAGQIDALLEPLTRRRVIYSCAVGAADPAGVPGLLTRLARDGDQLELRLHDYFPISPSYCLLDGDGRFRGVPEVGSADPAHGAPGGSHREWRALWGQAIRRADRITCFSDASRAILCRAYPEAGGSAEVVPHEPRLLPEPLESGGTAVGVLGGINRAKGARVLVDLARRLGRSRRIVVIGQLDPDFRLPRPHLVHGVYRRDEIAALARSYGIGVWLIPSVWPETFSFTTREALATGLPVLAFDLGAQAEAVAAAANGRVLRSAPDDGAGIAREIEAAFGLSRG